MKNLRDTVDVSSHHLQVDTLLRRFTRACARPFGAAGRPRQRRKILFETLEPRMLLSADLLPGAVQAPPGAQPPVQLHLSSSGQSPQIHWSAQSSAGAQALTTSGLVGTFDLDNFSSPLAPVAPVGSTVYAGGVQGTLDFDGDADDLTITLDAGQSFSLRLKPEAGVRASIEAFDPNGASLGRLDAANAGDSLVLQSRAASDAGTYTVSVASLEGAGSYTVELFLNAAIEDGENDSAAQAQNLDDVFSVLLDSDALRGSVVGELSGLLPQRTLASEDFQDGSAFWQRVDDGIWALDTQTNGNAGIYLTSGGGSSGASSMASAGQISAQSSSGEDSHLSMVDDQDYDYSEEWVDDGDGGSVRVEHYVYEASLNQATWRVDLSGTTQATLQFEQWSNDPFGNGIAAGSTFLGSANFDGVSVSTDGQVWVVLASFGEQPNYSRQQYSIDLVAAAAQAGITLGADTLIRFQSYNQGGDFDHDLGYQYRNFDNVRITTDQQQVLLHPVSTEASGTDYYNGLQLLSDGVVPRETMDFASDQTVYWFGQEIPDAFPDSLGSAGLAPSASGPAGLSFQFDLGSLQRVTDLQLSVDNNDSYAVDYSADGSSWIRLFTILDGDGDVGGGMDTFSSWSGSPEYQASIDFAPVTARYLRIYATGGDGWYSVGEVQAFTDAVLDQQDWYSLTLDEGELASFALGQQDAAAAGTLSLELYDASLALLTAGLPGEAQMGQAIENFRAPAAGTYYLRVGAGAGSGAYNLTAVKHAQFGPAAPHGQDLTLTPIVLDGLSQSQSEIRVAVLDNGSSNYLFDQLADDTWFGFSPTHVSLDQVDTLEELRQFDTLVLGDYFDRTYFNQIAPTVRQWVEGGGGLVMTGWSLWYTSLQYGSVNADLDAIVPVNLNTYTEYAYRASITVDDANHPVTQGLSEIAPAGGWDSYLVYGVNGVDDGATVLGSYGGRPAIVVGTPGAGHSVVLAPDYMNNGGWQAGAPDRLLEQAVAWSAQPSNRYTVSANAGTNLVVTLDLLGADAGEPANTLVPVLELFDAAGVLLASGSTVLDVAVTQDAQFTIQVRGAGSGDYLLRASADRPALAQQLQVVSSSLDGADALSYFPGYVDLQFDAPLLYTSLETLDLSVNGVAADSYQVLSPLSVRFWYGSALAGDGSYTLELAADGLTDIHGDMNAPWGHTFELDTHGPQVIASSVTEGATLAPGAQTITLTFDEDLDVSYLDAGDVSLHSAGSGQTIVAASVAYDAQTRTLTIVTPVLGEDQYTLRLRSDWYSVKDHVGNVLDGNADGVNGDDYTLNFGVDIDTVAYPPMQALPPLGSMVYDPVIAGYMNGTGDVDGYTVSLDAGQLLTVVADVRDAGLQVQVSVIDADDDSVVATQTGAVGEGVVLQTLAGLQGNYRIAVTSLDGSGRYDFALILNALLEAEALVGGAHNDSAADAADLAGSSIAVGTGADRLAIVGTRTGGALADDDYFRVHLDAGSVASFALAWAESNSSALTLDLLAADGSLITRGADNSRNARASIQDFVAPAAGDYLLRVSGSGVGRYNLVATRGISLSLPAARSGAPVQDISLTGQVLGALGGGMNSASSGIIAVLDSPDGYQDSGLRAIVQQINDHSFTSLTAVLVPVSGVDTLEELLQYDAIVIGGTGYNSNQFNAVAHNLKPYVEAGGGLVVTGWGIHAAGGLSGQDRSDFDSVVPVNIGTYSYYANSVLTPAGTHPVVDGVTPFRVSSYIEYPYYSPRLDTGATLLADIGGNGVPVAAAMEAGRGRSVYLGPIYAGGSGYNLTDLRSGAADRLLEQAVSWASGNRSRDFQFQAQAGADLAITLTVPVDGPGEPVNNLLPAIELRGPDGNPVTLQGSDGSWTVTATQAGSYTLKLRAVSGAGSYVLRVAGTRTDFNTPPTVVATSVPEGARLKALPGSLTLDLSENVLAGSLGVDDLTIDGGTVTGVEMLDGDSVRFLLALPAVDGTYHYTLRAGGLIDLQGAGNTAYSGSFVLDTTAPRVVSQAPQVQSLAPFSSWSVTFSEALDPATVQTGDFVLRNPGNGNVYINSATLSEDRMTVTLGFNGQYTQGNYTLTVGTEIYDVAGNRMDQDAGTAGNQAYVGTVQVASPDLSPTAISVLLPDGSAIPEGGVSLGGQVLVRWTVQNVGTDAARANYWYDSLWLSTDTQPSGDVWLGGYMVDVDPGNTVGLPAGASYTMSALVTLPLNDSVNPGNFHIRVQADNYGTYSYNWQPESNENNNALYSEGFTTALPSLPDLTMSDITAPAVIEASKNVTISWTVHNQGGAAVSGGRYDRIVLSQDQVFGNEDDVYLGDYYYADSLAAGASVQRSVTVNIPANLVGTWYVLGKTDSYNNIYERGNENNNTAASAQPVQVIIATEDLTPTSLTAPDAALFGAKIDVSWTVQNAGTGPTYGQWYDRLWLSTDAVRSSDDISLTWVYSNASPDVTPLAAGAQYTRSIQGITLPLNVSLANGTYYLLLETDAGQQEPESTEANNVIARPIALTLADYADLVITDVEVPAGTVNSGAPLTVQFTLKNQGEAAAQDFHNYLYLSSNGSTLNRYVGDYYVNQSLAPGESVAVSQSITVPLYEPGNWYLVVVADSWNQIYEHAKEGNNQAVSASPIQAVLPPLPDLVVSNIVAPVQALAGEIITLSWTITNQGTAAFTGSWGDQVYLATNGGSTLTQDFGVFTFEGTLAAGASVTRTQNLRLSATQDGARQFVVITDAYGNVNETPAGQNNNVTLDDTTLSISFPPLPNLQVTALVPPDAPASGTSTVLGWTVKNTGNGATSSATWYDEAHLSLNDVWGDGDDIYLGRTLNPNYLPAGESYQNSITISIPKGLSGDYYFLVKTDTYDQVFENQDEGDNVRASARTYIALTPPPDLRVDTVEAPNLAFSGQLATVSWTVGNHGQGRTVESGWYDRIVMSANDVLGDADDRNMGDFWHAGALDPDETYSVTKDVRLPVGVIGNFHFFVTTDVFNHVYEHGSDYNNSSEDMLSDGTGPELTEIRLTPPPDLEVLSVGTLASPLAGHTYTATWSVANLGATATPNNYWTDRVYLSSDATLDAGDVYLGARTHVGLLGVYEEDANGRPIAGYYDASLSIQLPFGISGAYRLIVQTDASNEVFEGFADPNAPDGEDNNTRASAPMTVVSKPADLVVSEVTAPPTGESGKPITVSWTVRNDGSGDSVAASWYDQIRLSVDDILFDDDDVVLQNVWHGGVLAAGASYSASQSVTLPFSVPGASYRVYVVTDAGGHVPESNEGNNTGYASIDVTRETPDLVVTSVAPAADGMVALPLNVSWRVENQGTNQTNAGIWYDEVYLSKDQVLGSGDILIGTRYRNAGLAAGAGYDASASFTLPYDMAPGDYYVIVRTDRDNWVVEGAAGEANNLRSSDTTVHVAAFDRNNPAGVLPNALLRPDLELVQVDAPSEAISGQFITVGWTVKNNGPDPTGNRSWYDAIYLSRDGVLDRNSDIYLGYAYHGNLAAGDSYTDSRSVQIPYGQSGPFYVFVVTDAGRSIAETDEFNNVGQHAAFTQVSLAPPADLVVGSITVPANGIPGQNATIGFSVNNQGSNPALGSWTDSVYLSADDSWDIGDALFGTVTHWGDVAGGSSYSSQLTAVLPGLTPGDYKVIVRSDIRNHIPESNEANNIGGSLDSIDIDVQALQLGVTQDGQLGTGQAVYYKLVVGAGETVRLHLDGANNDNANELYVRFGAMPTRGQFDVSAREGFAADRELVIPTTQAGTYYVLAYGQSVSGNSAYGLRADIIPFSITDVDADKVGNAGDVTLRIEGARFSDQTRFELVAPDGTKVRAHSVQLASSSEAFATFGMFQATPGAWDVVATQPDGATTAKPDAVQVKADFDAAVFMSIAGSSQVMVNRSNVFTLDYVNDGGADTAAPLMILTSYSATPVGFSASSMHTVPLQIMAASFDGPMDVLRPGARYSVPLVFQSPGQAGQLDLRVGRILADDTRLIEDWTTIESSIRPANISNEAWTVFWGRIKPLIGATWGEYVQVLDLMMKQVSEPGHPVRDVREIFARMYQQNPDFVPYASLAGQVCDSEAGTGLPAVQLAAYLVKADGSLQYKASAVSDDEGRFRFARLTPGEYKVMAVGRALDMNRDGQVDQTAPQFTLGYTQPGNAGILYVQPLGGIGSHNDSSAALERDSNGVTHMVWSRDGEIWHAWFDANSGQWKGAQAISSGDSYRPAIASSSKLFDSASPGIIAAWQQGKGNDAEIWYAVARAKAGGGFEWSAPVQLTNDHTMDAGAQIIVGDNGLVMITHLKSDADIQDDTDVYYDIFALSQSDFAWPQALAAGDAALDTEGVSLAYGREWKFGPWDFFGTEAEIKLGLSGSVGENNCVATLGAQGQVSGSFKGSSIRSTISGNGNVSAEWGVNQASKDWMFNGAKAGWGASAQFDWRYGLSTLLSKIPHPAVTSAYLAYSLGVGLAKRFGLEFEDGITFGGGASFSGMSWSFTQPFPDFVWPESIAEASLSGTLGVYAQLDVTGGDSARLQGDITVTVDIAPAVRLKSITGNITFSGNIGWFTFNEVFSIDFYSAGALEADGAPLQTQDTSGPLYDPAALFGTGNAYGSNHVLSDVSADRLGDSMMSLANDGGALFGAWTHMDDPTLAIGSSVMVAEFNGSTWDAPVALGGSAGINSYATAAVDGLGRRMVLWTHADSAALGTTPTIENYEAALDASDVVYALYDESTGHWGAMASVASTAGMDSKLALSHDAAGNLLLSWLTRSSDGLNHLMSARWNGSGWGSASEIAFGASVMDPAMAQLGNGVIVVWTEDANPNQDKSEKALHYSMYDGAAWSAGALFDPIAMATGLALSAGTPVPTVADTGLTTEGMFPPFPVPEECLKCKPEDIKRLRESAPECRDGGGTQVTFDDKTCTEKTIVYRPCVVRPRDPNDIIGPDGYGDDNWVAASSKLGYMIRFENAADASAPAQRVVITQQLDSDLDWRTFRVDDFGFGDQIIEVSGKDAFYQGRLDYTKDPARGYYLDVFASVDASTGIVTWTLTTIDPNTGDVPQDASIGFLPVNDTVYNDKHEVVVEGTQRGEGFVTYTIKARRDTATGTVVDAQALIVFDTEEPIETPSISNKLDADAPSSQVIAFSTANTDDPQFVVQWGGEDGSDGSGVRDYTIFVSVDGGAFSIWQINTASTEAIYLGAKGHTYGFYSTARDQAGNEEAQPDGADAQITVAGGFGAISGTKFEDTDGDGVRDEGEAGLAGWTFYLDANDNGAFDDGEVSTVSGTDGSYHFIDLAPGSYLVRELPQTGWVQTMAGNAGVPVSVLVDQTSSGIDFGNFALGQIGGLLFNDSNANGIQDDGEAGLADWVVNLDLDGNGSIDATATTDFYGYYRFTGVGPGSYRITEVPQAGWLQVAPGTAGHTVTMTSGADNGARDFANVLGASITGVKFEDVNGNGQRDAGEAGLAGWTIFLDGNGNGMLDSGERSTVTGSDGSYAFTGLLPGSYIVAEVMQDGWLQTAPGTSTGAIARADLTLSGMEVALSLPEDVLVEEGQSTLTLSSNDLADALVNLDALRADPRFAHLNGSGVTTVVIDTGIDLNHPWFGADANHDGVADRIVFSWDFADNDADASDRNGHGSHVASLIAGQDARYGGVAPGADLIVLKVFSDSGLGYFSYLEQALQWVVANADSYHIGVVNLSLGDSGNWNTAIGRYGLGDELAALASHDILVTAAAGNNFFQLGSRMGVAYPAADPAVLAVGAVWSGSFGGPVNYANGAIDYSTGADHLAAFGQRDEALLDVLAPGTRLVGANYNGGTRTMFGTSQASAYMAGVATLAQDLAQQHLGRRLNLGEFNTLLHSTGVMVLDGDDENDNVVNTGLQFPRVDVLALAEGILALHGNGSSSGGGGTGGDGQTHVLGASGVYQFTLTAGEQRSAVDFGNFALGSIAGTVFDDANADQAQGSGEAGLSGRTVFLDGNSNGTLDVGEHSATSDANGHYRFDDVGPGSYRVTVVPQTGWSTSTAGFFDVAMTSGLDAERNFGLVKQPETLQVTGLQVTPTGVAISFNQAVSAEQLNLVDSEFYHRGAADLHLVDGQGRSVAGSMVLDADGKGLRFIKTGGLLDAGSYTLTLDSRSDAFVGSLGLLDGDADGVAGGDYHASFSVSGAGSSAVLQIGEFSRGPGQGVDLPATAAGIPVRITGATGATQVSFTLGYDARLLQITGVAGASGLPAGSSVAADFGTPGQVRISVTLGSALGAGGLDLVRLVANVPADAPYGATQVLDLRDIVLDTGAPVLDDDGLQLVAYLGDASGNARYSALDVQRIQRVVAGYDSGFGAYRMVDPVVVADINGNGTLTALDAQRVLAEASGIDRPEIPPIPQGLPQNLGPTEPSDAAPLPPATPTTPAPAPVVVVPAPAPAPEPAPVVATPAPAPTPEVPVAPPVVVAPDPVPPAPAAPAPAPEMTVPPAAPAPTPEVAVPPVAPTTPAPEVAGPAPTPVPEPTVPTPAVMAEPAPAAPATQAPPASAPAATAVVTEATPVPPAAAQASGASPAPAPGLPASPLQTAGREQAAATLAEWPSVDFAALRASAAHAADALGLAQPAGGHALPQIRFDAPPSAQLQERMPQHDWIGDWLGNRQQDKADRRANNWKINLGATRPLSRL